MDGNQWRLQPFSLGEGERLDIQKNRIAGADQRSRSVTVPNDVQLTSFVKDATAQSANVVDVNKKEWWYTRSFKTPAVERGRRATLVFDGVDYFADVWLNGAKLGSHEGAYTRFSFDVTAHISSKAENFLAVRVTAPWKVPGRSHYEFMKGEFEEYWDALPGPGMVVYPLGLHRSVRLEITSETRLEDVNVSTVAIQDRNAEIKVLLDLSNVRRKAAGDLRLTILPDNFSGKQVVIPPRSFSFDKASVGKQRIEVSVSIPDPQLWWTWDLGPQNLYRIEAKLTGQDGVALDRLVTTFGIRRFERDAKLLYRINGRPILFRGAWYAMSKLYPAATDAWTYEKDLRLARNANMNHLVNYTVIEKDSFYDLADRLGIALFVELPFNQEGPIDALNAAYPRRSAFIEWASSEAGQIVRSLANHPSIAVWSPVSEVTENGHDFKVGWDHRVEEAADGYALFVKAMQDVVGENDPDALYFRSYCDFGEHHFWEGTFFSGTTYDQQFDASASFISEYGAQALFPYEDASRSVDLEKLWQPGDERWSPVLLPIRLKSVSYLQPWQYFGLDFFTANIGANVARNIRSWREYIRDSELYQAFIYSYAADAYRRKLFAPVNGIRSWMLKSFPEIPVGGFGVIDAFDHATPAYYEQKRTFAPVSMSFARRFALESVSAGSILDIPVWVSNAGVEPLARATVELSLFDLQGKALQSRTVTTSVSANHAEAVSNVSWRVPQNPGIYVLRGWTRQDGKALASAESYLKVVPGATQERVLVIGSPDWAQPVSGYLAGLGATVTTLLAEYSAFRSMQLPNSAAELKNQYDVIWLAGYDKYWREAPEALTTLIVEAVRLGVTFVHTGSPASFHGGGENTAALDLTSLEPLLPVKLASENDVFWASSFRIGSEPNPLASHQERNVVITGEAPQWMRQMQTTGLAPSSFHMLPARNGAHVLMTIDGLPLLVQGQFGKGTTFAYLGFTPELTKGSSNPPIVLDRVIRASAENRQFATVSAILLKLISNEASQVKVADLIDSRTKPLFESLIDLPRWNLKSLSASWARKRNGQLSGHVHVVNGDTYAFGIRMRLAGPDEQTGRVLQVWSNQFLNLLPREFADCEVTVYSEDLKLPGTLSLIAEDSAGRLVTQPVRY